LSRRIEAQFLYYNAVLHSSTPTGCLRRSPKNPFERGGAGRDLTFTMLNDIIVYDIETKDTFQQIGGRDPKRLHISVVGAYSYLENRLIAFNEDELPQLWRRFEQCKMVVGFNNKGFDDQVCTAYFPEMAKVPSFDLLEAFHKSLGFRVKLDNLAQATLGTGKSGDGLHAVQLYAEGKIDELLSYCLDDVKITQELYEYGKRNGRVKYSDLAGPKECLVDFNYEPPRPDAALNLSLF
jgi:hypothetical protein